MAQATEHGADSRSATGPDSADLALANVFGLDRDVIDSEPLPEYPMPSLLDVIEGHGTE